MEFILLIIGSSENDWKIMIYSSDRNKNCFSFLKLNFIQLLWWVRVKRCLRDLKFGLCGLPVHRLKKVKVFKTYLKFLKYNIVKNVPRCFLLIFEIKWNMTKLSAPKVGSMSIKRVKKSGEKVDTTKRHFFSIRVGEADWYS